MRRASTLPIVSALVLAASGGCVLPDVDIVIVDEDVQNKHPVRFVESTPLTNEAANACLQALPKDSTDVCQPGEPEDKLPAFLDPTLVDEEGVYRYRFCSCNPDEEDYSKLPETTLYVEDRADDVGDGLGNLYAVLQLDIAPTELTPQRKSAYTFAVDPGVPLKKSTFKGYEPPKRTPSAAGRELREISLGFADGRRLDLCNDAGQPLTRGFHTLRVLVTDMPWFIPLPGKPGEIVDESERQPGVPDIANGATYDALTFTFFCGRYQAAGPNNEPPEVDGHCDEQCIPPGALE